MATPQLSPGVLVREVDLTVGRADNVLDNIGAIAGPFAIGPVDEAIDITTENELLSVFGKPSNNDGQYEYWMTASSYLSYGGVLKVVRTSGESLVTANANRSGVGSETLLIKNFDDYQSNYADDIANYVFAAKSPGSWANDLKVCVIDDKADQILIGISTANLTVGMAVTTALNNLPAVGVGTTSSFTGHLKGVITGVGNSSIDVKILSLIDSNEVEVNVTYAQRSQLRSFRPSNVIKISSDNAPIGTLTIPPLQSNVVDWYDQQTISLANNTVFWKSIAPKPQTNDYVLDRGGKNDSLHVVIIDDNGTVTGIQGNILEKHLNISKAIDGFSSLSAPQRIWWKDYIGLYSKYIYVGDNPSDNEDGETVYQTNIGISTAEGLWNQPALNRSFSAIGNVTYTLAGGNDYGENGEMKVTLGDLITSYRLFSNNAEIGVDYLLMGPGLSNKLESQAKAQELISIATTRKDCMAVISPHSADVLDLTNTDVQTDNIIEFFSALSSSSYAVFECGYKYTYDRFNNKFRYIPCNGDIAGLMVRTSILTYPWFSPAGQQRGILNNAIKLTYNPNKTQRDQLYTARINSVINQPGIGILLYGDKTAVGYSSAFDRINVRRLFLTVEQALERASQAQLFEVNDEITRANFVNIVEPYLRDVQAKRGLYGFYVVCDSTNNTPDIIDNNEFRADIYLKPTKSINYVTLTFVATRTGVSFEEVAGTI